MMRDALFVEECQELSKLEQWNHASLVDDVDDGSIKSKMKKEDCVLRIRDDETELSMNRILWMFGNIWYQCRETVVEWSDTFHHNEHPSPIF